MTCLAIWLATLTGHPVAVVYLPLYAPIQAPAVSAPPPAPARTLPGPGEIILRRT